MRTDSGKEARPGHQEDPRMEPLRAVFFSGGVRRFSALHVVDPFKAEAQRAELKSCHLRLRG